MIKRRIPAVMLALLLVLCSQSNCSAPTESAPKERPSATFDEGNIVLQFAALSDLHIGRNGANTEFYIKDAYKQLRDLAAQYTDHGIDAVVIAGDLINNATTKQIEDFAELYESVFDPREVPLVFSLGNHDVQVDSSSYCWGDQDFESFYITLGEEYRGYETETSDLDIGCVHQIVNGYHFLAINPLDEGYRNSLDGSALYATEAKEWLDKTLADITKKNPNQYVFVATHPLIFGTAYGSELTYTTTAWFTRELTDILKKYPQAVTLGGHLHFSINSDLSIMQTDFTALQCGSANYMGVEDGDYKYMLNPTNMYDCDYIRTGYLVQVDQVGCVRILRLNFGLEGQIKEPFELIAPQDDGSHLLKYTWDRGNSDHNEAPVLVEDAITITDNGDQVTADQALKVDLIFQAATDDDQVHSYAITIREDDMIIECERILADFYKVLQPEDMDKEWRVTLDENKYYKGHTYEIMLVAGDDWGTASNIIKYTYAP